MSALTALSAIHHSPVERISGPVLHIDLDAIAQNHRALRRLAPAATIAAVVKADAYGIGAEPVARRLLEEDCGLFFVATFGEAVALRRVLGSTPEILILNGVAPADIAACHALRLTPVLNSLVQAKAWAAAGAQGRRKAVLQVDTGMSRLGLSVAEQAQLIATPGLREQLDLGLIMSHLAIADEPDHPGNVAQWQAFQSARQRFPSVPASLANSAGLFLGPDYHFDLCRPGAALYGIESGPRMTGIRPVMRLTAPVIQIRTIERDTAVGYGYSFRASRMMRLATVGVGYADGWPRRFAESGAAYFGDRRLPIVGRVSMDSFSVDVSALPGEALKEGDRLELIGPHQSADDVARAAGTIGYEILTSFGKRHHKIYSGWSLS
ncbi:alanine racemase [Kaistia algarum]|uniref:alanine racemase n=1 Tax=Kaistia algarum TaxID=2083279 RepID=UPI000CE76BA2|nr:alanine racemase [Kaistia algarum]MCX5514425.1 alanine racemase [Kaistia algarum]PPE79162.1 alanine racemase [Kaistia algarum]